MAYRGEDLDLRTPQGWGPAGRDQAGAEQANWWTRSTVYHGGRADPLWVDDTVLSCCNHAYDLALAHRAPEVRLEHLLNALTLNTAAAQVLEARGIRDAALRRESGAIIAAEIPSGHVNGKANPKRSEALEETLRLAADRAYPRRTPVTVDDLLQAMFEIKRDLPGLQLLFRHAGSLQGRTNGAEPRSTVRLEPLPHLARTYGGEGRADHFDDIRTRREQPTHDYYSGGMTGRPKRDRERERETGGSTVDSMQNNRIEALERAVRDLGLDLADDRKSLQSIVSDLQRDTVAQGDDTLRFRGGLSDRLGSLEESLGRLRNEPMQMPTDIVDRLVDLDRNLDARLADMARGIQASSTMIDRLSSIERSLESRLTDLGRVWTGIGDRLTAIEASARRPLPAPILPANLIERLESISGLDGKLENMSAIERKLDGIVGLEQKIDNVSKLTSKVDALEDTFQLILDRMVGLERHMESSSDRSEFDLGPIEAKLVAFQQSVVEKLSEGGDGLAIAEQLTGIERALENRTAETGRTVSFIGERLRAFDEAIGTQRTQTTDRLAHLEKLVTSYASGVSEAGASHSHDLSELHEAIVKLNANQQTLANSLEQWRLDNTGDLSVVSNRLKSIEESDDRHEPVFTALAQQLSAVHDVIAKREAHKSKARNWLFGTNEWFSASYDTERWRSRQQAAELASELTGGQIRVAPPPTPAKR